MDFLAVFFRGLFGVSWFCWFAKIAKRQSDFKKREKIEWK